MPNSQSGYQTPPQDALPPMAEDNLSILDVIRGIVDAIEDKKGENPVALDLIGTLDYLDYMVICNGQTAIHNRAIADSIEQALANYDIIPDGLHGRNHGDWIVIDYGVVVVHIFVLELRNFYQLENLWASGNLVEL